MRYTVAMLLAGCVALVSCSREPAEPTPGGEPVPFETLASVTLSEVESPTYTIILDQESWATIWAAIVAGQLWPQPPPPPTIDFESQVVLIAGAGELSTQLLSFRIDEVRLQDGILEVVVHEDWPAPQCGSLPVVTHPVHAISVPRLSASADFVTRRTSRC